MNNNEISTRDRGVLKESDNMDIEKFTAKMQEAIQKARSISIKL